MQNDELNPQYFERQRTGRLILLSMLIFFIAPIVTVLAMYKYDWRPTGVSIGELIVPAHLISMDAAIQQNDGTSVNHEVWKDKWSMVYVSEACEDVCQRKLHDMRQLHVSLYKDILRMQRVLITTSTEVSQLKKDYPDMLILNQPMQSVVDLMQQFEVNHQPASHSNSIYLVDPLGHAMMRYAPNVEAKLVRKDIIRLMKYSWAG